MTENRSMMDNLMHRRVPQLVGMYVAATWLVIELGDWITERFNLPESLTTYVFVAMLALLPAVVLFAYNHGAPGKDQWTKSERWFIPLNVVVTLGLLYVVSPMLVVEAATETVQLPDETGTLQEFEVARQGYHKEVIGFFWRNESGNDDLDWLSYGLPLMLAHDLNRISPVLTVRTPFDSSAMMNELTNRGYPEFVGMPNGLRIEIARDRRSGAVIVGSFAESDGQVMIEATMIDVPSGDVIGTQSVTSDDWFTAVDDVSFGVLEHLDVEPSDNQSNDPVSQHFSDSLEAIRHFTNGRIALEIRNDYPGGISEFQSALALDPRFAEASGELSMTHYLSSDVEAARETASQALRSGYRLSERSKFILKANRYIYDGDYERGERVVEIWTQVRPNSTDAFRAMAQLNRFRGTDESLGKAMAAYERLLELDPKDSEVLLRKAELEQQRADYDAAANYMRQFLDQEPDSGSAHMQLADIYQAMGDLERAQTALEDASILSENPLESEIGLARLEARRGQFDAAEIRLDSQLTDNLSPQQRVSILTTSAQIAVIRGQIHKAMNLFSTVSEVGAAFMPPMVRLMMIENQQATLLGLLGQTDEAIAAADAITAQLQPPIDAYMNFTYIGIYGDANEREAFRSRVGQTVQVREQMPPMMHPFIEMGIAQSLIWDGNPETAITHLDQARDKLDQSMVQNFLSDLSTTSVLVALADLYLQAGALEAASKRLDGILKTFPADARALIAKAKIHMEQGDNDAARKALTDALHTWSDADAEFIYAAEARSLMDSLDAPGSEGGQ